jgi:hypothetical protein
MSHDGKKSPNDKETGEFSNTGSPGPAHPSAKDSDPEAKRASPAQSAMDSNARADAHSSAHPAAESRNPSSPLRASETLGAGSGAPSR